MPLQPGLLQLVNRVTGAARRSGGRTVRFLAVYRARVSFGWSAGGAGRRTRRRRGRWTRYRCRARSRANRRIQRANAARAGWPHGSVSARCPGRRTDCCHGAFLRRLRIGLGQQSHRGINHGRDRSRCRGDQRARLARSREHRRADALKRQRLRLLRPAFFADLEGNRLARILGQRGGRRFSLRRSGSLDSKIERLRLERRRVQLRLRVLHRLAGLLVGTRVMGGMRDGPGERRRGGGRGRAVKRRRR